MNSAVGAMTTGPGRIIMMLAGIVILCVCLYYLYKYLNGAAEKADMVVFSNSSGGLPGQDATASEFKVQPSSGSGTNAVAGSSQIPAIYKGGEYSVSIWIYVANWGINANKNKTFLTIDGGGGNFNTLQMYMGASTNKMGIRVSTQSPNSKNPMLFTGTGTNASIQGTLNAGQASPYSDGEQDFLQGDLQAVDLQKWVHVCVVLSGRRLDVYMDGKLTRSVVLGSMFDVDGNGSTYKMKVGGPNGFGGLIGQINAANFAYTPDRVWALYNNGPEDTSIWTQFLKYFDPGQYSFSLKRNGETIASGSTPS
uniref:Lectin/glucanase superfamily protein n=1 Tax=viral metagenome TaxID=1070528 RepID=A0A6C0LRF9_9ZZZZ